MMAIESLMGRHGLKPIAFWPAHTEWREAPEFHRALDCAHLVIINGEGTIHHDRPAGRRLLELGVLAKSAQVPAALINVGWESNGVDQTTMLKDFTLLSARDTRSAKAMRKGGETVRVVPDLSLVSPIEPARSATRSGIYFSDNVERFKALDLERCRRACGGKTVAITYPGEHSYSKFLRQGLSLREDFRRPFIAYNLLLLRHRLWCHATHDRAEFLNTLSKLRLLVSGRFHASTLALRAGTPFVTQASNTSKIAAFIEDAGLARWRTNITLDRECILNAAWRGWERYEIEAARDYLASAQSAADGLFRDLRELVT